MKRPSEEPPVSALPSLRLAMLLPSTSPPRPAPFPLDHLTSSVRDDNAGDDHHRLYYLARNGIYHGLRALGLGAGDRVLMPAWHHGVEVEAVRHTGAEPIFYRVDERMRADLDDAERRADSTNVRALYLTHFAGMPQAIDEARALSRSRGLFLVEDCALGLLSRDPLGRPLGIHGDLSVFCLYKTLPVPHGGIAVCSAPLPRFVRPPLTATLHHLAGSLLQRAESAGGAPARVMRAAARAASRKVIDRVIDYPKVGTQHLVPSELLLGGSPLVRLIARRLDSELIAVRRRRNYTRLLQHLGDDAHSPTGPLADGAVPLFFPLAVANRRAALTRLWARGIEAVDFWSTGDPGCDEASFPEVRALRRHVIEIPIHQDLDDEAIDRVARTVKDVIAQVG